MHINGNIVQGKTSIVLSLLVNGDGEGGGSFTQEGSRIQLKRVGPLLYFNAPKKYWASHANAAQTKAYGGKWIEVSALDARFQSFDQFLNAGDLAAAVFQGYTTAAHRLASPRRSTGTRWSSSATRPPPRARRARCRCTSRPPGTPYVLQDRRPGADPVDDAELHVLRQCGLHLHAA